MQDVAATTLAPWESFYVIVGSSGGALTGLQFVVMALVAETRPRSSTGTIDAFGTPTIVHFCVVLLVASVLSAPWQALSSVAVVLGTCGTGGIGYTGLVTRRAKRQTGYEPVFEDWLWHMILPFIAYAMLLSAALTLVRYSTVALFMVGATTLLLLFIGIHNAWDTVTYITIKHLARSQEERGGA